MLHPSSPVETCTCSPTRLASLGRRPLCVLAGVCATLMPQNGMVCHVSGGEQVINAHHRQTQSIRLQWNSLLQPCTRSRSINKHSMQRTCTHESKPSSTTVHAHKPLPTAGVPLNDRPAHTPKHQVGLLPHSMTRHLRAAVLADGCLTRQGERPGNEGIACATQQDIKPRCCPTGIHYPIDSPVLPKPGAQQ